MDNIYKLVVLGDTEIDRNSLIDSFSFKSIILDNPRKTIGVNLCDMIVESSSDNLIAKLQAWKISSSKIFESFIPNYCRVSHGAIMLFDLTLPKSWKEILNYWSTIEQNAGDIPVLVIGFKKNLAERSGGISDTNEIKKYVESKGSIYIETDEIKGDKIYSGIIDLIRAMKKNEKNEKYKMN